MINREQAQALIAFLDSFDLHITGAWATIEQAMRDEFGIDDPESAIESARSALQEV
jgi:hypothetical protein